MDDHKNPFKSSPLPLQGPHWNRLPETVSFFPLRLLLQPGELFVDLNKPDMVAGRHSTADVRLQMPDISRRHCRFVFKDGCWQVFDLNSLNGVFVNGEKVPQSVLSNKDHLQIGSLMFEVTFLQPAASPNVLADQREAS